VSLGLKEGDVIDGFVVVERLHAGGMGVLYRCAPPQDRPDLDVPLLIKVPRLGPGEPSESVVTYEVEVTVHSALAGPHVPRFVAAGDLARQPYIVMERIEGQSLKDWTDRAPLPAEEVAALGAAIATALHALHAQEAIHLDLKPANVILRPDGTAFAARHPVGREGKKLGTDVPARMVRRASAHRHRSRAGSRLPRGGRLQAQAGGVISGWRPG